MKIVPPVSIETRRLLPSSWDLMAAIFVMGAIVLFAEASRDVAQPITSLARNSVSLDPANLPGYAFRTALRMLVALGVSLVFTFTYATWAAKSPRAGALLVPLLDILQSIPILGFLSVTLVFFLALAPGKVLGAELAAVFLIFTSQAWNMAFSFYQSLRTVPPELTEAGRLFGLNAWARFWRIEVPFGMPQLVWNMMMSMSGAWFFVVAAEVFTVGNTEITLPGIGSYVAAALAAKSLAAIGWAVLAMLIVILIFDQLLFRPLVAWADRFRIDAEPGDEVEESWALKMFRRSRIFEAMGVPFDRMMQWTYRRSLPGRVLPAAKIPVAPRIGAWIWYVVLVALGGYIIWRVASFVGASLGFSDLVGAVLRGMATMTRVVVLIALASVIWVPIGVLVGLRPQLTRVVQPIAQFLAAFPANLLYPVVFFLIVRYALNPDVWLSPLMVLGTQWYILFNVIAGASALPRELRDAGTNLGVKGWLWWRKVALPAVFPYYVTGAITASGGSWNAAIVAEVLSWGNKTLHAFGLGAYITDASVKGDFHRVVLGMFVMSFFVVVVNRLFWRPLYWYAERKFRLE
ncbi:MAG TPA: ABC transporter permease subunit [Rhizomicrobium sp.]|nr:ABC transporter permease subunit [Rhizomicrobium sp.]